MALYLYVYSMYHIVMKWHAKDFSYSRLKQLDQNLIIFEICEFFLKIMEILNRLS